MNRTMITATNTLTQLQKQMDIISNNMANVDTTGFKKRQATFTDLLHQQFTNQRDVTQEINRLSPIGIRQGTGARIAQTQTVMAQGNIKSSDRALDLAFTKENQVLRVLVQNQNSNATEVHYTRDGALYLSPISDTENMLVTKDGHAVLDENNNPILLDNNAQSFTLTSSGALTAESSNGVVQTVNLGVSLVNNPQTLENAGNNLYRLPPIVADGQAITDLNGAQRELIALKQFALEQSNVDISTEMVQLIATQRSYQFQSKSITIADQMMGLVNEIR